MENFDEILKNINLIRPVGSENHALVRKYIVTRLENIGWDVELDTFTNLTVIGNVTFRNIIAINNRYAARRLVLACHYDSKMIKNFYGTIDSAVSCAIMVNIADSLSKVFDSSKSDIALQLIFFDGEEAFHEWTDDDSIYGSRHLAAKMSTKGSNGCSDIERMDLFILMDLVGAAGYPFPQYPHCDSRIYDVLRNLELISSPFFLPKSQKVEAGLSSYFSLRSYGGIQDDHIPFLKRRVPVLHLIPAPFPLQWHNLTDTIDNVDRKTVHDVQLLVAGFLCQYLQVSPSKVDHG
nr:glutaminyl peptide cyclotransferase [Hymenolepis microstoma]